MNVFVCVVLRLLKPLDLLKFSRTIFSMSLCMAVQYVS